MRLASTPDPAAQARGMRCFLIGRLPDACLLAFVRPVATLLVLFGPIVTCVHSDLSCNMKVT
jgi:hypothetical protein